MLFKFIQIDEFERRNMGGPEENARGASCLQCFHPATEADTPAISLLQSGKLVLRVGCDQIIPTLPTKFQKRIGHFHTYHVETMIARTGVALAVAIVARDWICAAGLQWCA